MNEPCEKAADISRPGEIIDFGSLARVLWSWRIFFISGFIALTVIGTLLVFLLPRPFRCEAVFQVGNSAKREGDSASPERIGLNLSFFREGEAVLYNVENLRERMSAEPSIDPAARERFFLSNDRNEKLKKYFVPVFDFSKAAELPQDRAIKESSVVAFRLSYEAEKAETANRFVAFFGSYVRSCYLGIDLKRYLRANYEANSLSVRDMENRKIEGQKNIERTQAKRDQLQGLAKRFTKVAAGDTRQLAKFPDHSPHYLLPGVNLMATESSLVDGILDLERQEWRLEISRSLLAFFSRAYELLESPSADGIALLDKLNALKGEMFPEAGTKSPAVLYVNNSLNNDMQRFQNYYYGTFRFVSGPAVLPPETGSEKILEVVGVMTFSLMLMLLATLLRHWWKRNWPGIRAGK